MVNTPTAPRREGGSIQSLTGIATFLLSIACIAEIVSLAIDGFAFAELLKASPADPNSEAHRLGMGAALRHMLGCCQSLGLLVLAIAASRWLAKIDRDRDAVPTVPAS